MTVPLVVVVVLLLLVADTRLSLPARLGIPPRDSARHDMATTLAAVTRVPAASLHVSKPVWWLKSRFHFSFADHVYADASRQRFGALRGALMRHTDYYYYYSLSVCLSVCLPACMHAFLPMTNKIKPNQTSPKD